MRLATCIAEGILLIRLVRLGSPVSITSIIDKYTYSRSEIGAPSSLVIFLRKRNLFA